MFNKSRVTVFQTQCSSLGLTMKHYFSNTFPIHIILHSFIEMDSWTHDLIIKQQECIPIIV